MSPRIFEEMMRSFAIRLLVVTVALFLVGHSGYARQRSHATITFDNRSGEPARVKLIGPLKRTVEVANKQKRTVGAIGGRYYILTRYGANPNHYTYSKGDPFTVVQTARKYSVITITLHKVINGNYHTVPTTAEEFNGANP